MKKFISLICWSRSSRGVGGGLKRKLNYEDVEYKGHFCSECSIPPPGGVLYVGGFVGMVVLGCGKQVLGVRAAKTTTTVTIERV